MIDLFYIYLYFAFFFNFAILLAFCIDYNVQMLTNSVLEKVQFLFIRDN
jgi:hypothetical protein